VFQNLKALVVILAVAVAVFVIAKPVFLRFASQEDFARRRNVWFALTIVAFISPNFWLYVLIAVPLMIWAGRADSNPIALYLLLFFVIPPMSIQIPAIGINQLFDLGQARLLNFTILIPAVIKAIQGRIKGEKSGFSGADVFLLLYGALQLALFIPYESLTNTARRGFLFFLDTYLVYFAFSRLAVRREAIGDAASMVCLSALVLAPLAVFESLKNWLLFVGIGELWGSPNVFAWLVRGENLRAQTATGHSLELGMVMAMSIGLWLYLKSFVASKTANTLIFGLFSAGLLVTYSRGPWLSAALLVVLFFFLGSRNLANLAKGMFLIAVVGGLVLASPLGSGIVDKLPFIGSADQETVTYRQQLAEVSWKLIQQNPVFGSPFVALDMEELRQGQGIIDLVNGYASVALYYGLVGLTLFVTALTLPFIKAYLYARQAKALGEIDDMLIGASLIACMASILFFIATAGPIWLTWPIVGLLRAYAGRQHESARQDLNIDLMQKTPNSRSASAYSSS
jgi:hypothetical protein